MSTLRLGVTGARGWIGRRLCEVAAARAVRVRAVSREELGSVAACRAALEGCDAVVHLAARAHLPAARADAGEHERANVDVSRVVAEAAAGTASVARVVLVSSAKAADAHARAPGLEPGAGATADPYARSKLASERAMEAAAAGTRLELVVVRPPLVYGPGVRANFLALLRLADTPWPLPLADARGRRSMVYVDNLVDALLFVCESSNAAGRTLSVADGTDFDVCDLVRELRRRLGRDERLFRLPPAGWRLSLRLSRIVGVDLAGARDRLFEASQVEGDALRTLGWRAPVDPGRALDETVRWYRSR